MSGEINISWRAPGPVASAFMASKKFVQGIGGPVGSGKTTANFIKHIVNAHNQKPSTRDGIRKYKLCVVRDTYRQIWKTTLPTWWRRVPRTEGDFIGAENAPATHRVTFELRDRTLVEFQVDFVGIGENAVEDVLRGYEPTAFLLNEADLLAREVYTYARSRVGRFPGADEGGPTWCGLTMDFNAPELESWLYTDLFDDLKRPDDVDLLIQPSGFSPNAENVANLPPNYYINMAKGAPDWFVARMIENKPGYSRAGKPIFPEFNDNLHVSHAADLIPELPLMIGCDAGGSPAAVFGQRMPNGRWHIIDELVAEQGTGALRFGDNLAQRLHERFAAVRSMRGYADPSAAYGADKRAGELDWIEMVSARAGVRIDAAPTNALMPRLEAVRKPLTLLVDAKPSLLLNPRCTMLRKGFNNGYRYRKVQGTVSDRYHEEPEKNEYSHPMDALQYLLSAGGEDLEIRERKRSSLRELEAMGDGAVRDWDPLGRS
jgi:hypothetical protein